MVRGGRGISWGRSSQKAEQLPPEMHHVEAVHHWSFEADLRDTETAVDWQLRNINSAIYTA